MVRGLAVIRLSAAIILARAKVAKVCMARLGLYVGCGLYGLWAMASEG